MLEIEAAFLDLDGDRENVIDRAIRLAQSAQRR
jgi:hypothetical protein